MSLYIKLKEHKLLLSLLLSAIIGVIVSMISGFNYTFSGKDDYVMSLLIIDGDANSIFLSCFLTYPLVFLQKTVPFINWFGFTQEINCFLSLIIINYVFLSKLMDIYSYIISAVTSIIIFTSSILVVNWTHTAVVMCTAGIILMLYSLQNEMRKKYKIIQLIISFVCIFIGSCFRITAAKVCFIFVALLVGCYLLCELIKQRNLHKKIVSNVIYSLKKYGKIVISLILISTVCLGSGYISGKIKETDNKFQEYVAFNHGRSNITDYELASYDNNKDFYNNQGINSIDDYLMLNHNNIDRDYFNSQRLNAIGDYSRNKVLQGSSQLTFAIKKNLKTIIRKINNIKNTLSIPIGNRAFVLLLFGTILFLFLCFACILFLLRKKNQRLYFIIKRFIPGLLLLLLLGGYNWIFEINNNTILFLWFFAFVGSTIWFGNKYYFILCSVFSIAIMLLNCYQSCFRTSFRVTFTFLLPTILFLMYSFDKSYIKKSVSENNAKKRKICSIIASAVLVLFTIIVEIFLWNNLFVPTTGVNDQRLTEYIRDNPNVLFAHLTSLNRVMDTNFSCLYKIPNYPSNTLNYGGWNVASAAYDNELEEKHINCLFADLVNNKNMKLLLQYSDEYDIAKTYEGYFNNHYAEDGKKIKLVKEDEFDGSTSFWGSKTDDYQIGVYSVIQN